MDTKRRFGYADDICLYQASLSLDSNVELLAADLRQIRAWERPTRSPLLRKSRK